MPEEQPTPQLKALCPVHGHQMAHIHTWDGRHWFECDAFSRGQRCSCKIDYPSEPKPQTDDQP